MFHKQKKSMRIMMVVEEEEVVSYHTHSKAKAKATGDGGKRRSGSTHPPRSSAHHASHGRPGLLMLGDGAGGAGGVGGVGGTLSTPVPESLAMDGQRAPGPRKRRLFGDEGATAGSSSGHRRARIDGVGVRSLRVDGGHRSPGEHPHPHAMLKKKTKK